MYKGTEMIPMKHSDAKQSNTKRTVKRGCDFGEFENEELTGKAGEVVLFDGRMIHDSKRPEPSCVLSGLRWQRHVYFIAATNSDDIEIGTF